MFIGKLQTNKDETTILYNTFSEAINGLYNRINNSQAIIQKAEILETYYIGNNENFGNYESFKLIASLRTIR